ncbi:MFS monocarboxylate transporter-like protein [Rhexocercosporidium sp. MPI-PUGE-AT-0058]|nr:MFS monocarboxylate transporter-like protein [Rhexocercosporidium sp. MPI-PUGE-AT-0058]
MPSTLSVKDKRKESGEPFTDSTLDVPTQPEATNPVPNQIPNGGLLAWLQVIGAFFLFMNSWGVTNAFGVYQAYYETDLLKNVSASNISWIGSCQACLLLIIGVITGPIYDAGYFNSLLIAGSFLVVFGMMMTSIATKFWQILLAQGLFIGFGSGCLFIPSVAIVSTYFSTKKSFATGIVASGSSIGGIIYPIIFHQLQPRIGFGWATRVIAFIMLATLAVSMSVLKARVKPSSKRQLLQLSAFREIPYTMFGVAEFLGFMGLYIPFFYVQLYASQKTDMSGTLGFYMLPLLNFASIFGRIIPNFLADKMGPFNILIPCSLISAVLAFCWIKINTTAGLIIFCIFYGFFSGTFVSLPPTTVVSLSPDMGVVGVRMGMSFSLAGLGLLIGNPVAGAILGSGSWLGVQVFCGASVALAALACIIARISKVGPELLVKA